MLGLLRIPEFWNKKETIDVDFKTKFMFNYMVGGALHRLSPSSSTIWPDLLLYTSKPVHVPTCLQIGGEAAHGDWIVLLCPLTPPESDIVDFYITVPLKALNVSQCVDVVK